jgi:hypothetical protein
VLVQLEKGNPDDALRMCGALLITAAAIGNDANASSLDYFAWSNRQSSIHSALRMLARTLGQGEGKESLLLELQQMLEREDHPFLEPLLRKERARVVSFLTHPPSTTSFHSWPYLPYPDGGLDAKYNGVPHVPELGELIFHSSTATLDAQGGEIVRLLTDSIAGISASVSAPTPMLRGLGFPTSQVEDYQCSLNQPAMFFACFRCQLRTTIVALALERYRLAHGVWPSTLDELTPTFLKSIPHGQFDQKPLIYKRLKDGVIVYTLGADLADRGGMFLRGQWHSGRTDIGVRLWDPAYRRQAAQSPNGDK